MTIPFDDGAADTMISAAKGAAECLRGQAGSRRRLAEDAATDFAGAYARSFETECATEASDRGKLASELDSLVTQVEEAKKQAQAEKDRIAAHDAWQGREDTRDRKRRAAMYSGAPTLGSESPDPEPPSDPNPAPIVSADFATAARNRNAAGGSGGVSSAVPERLERFASGTSAANRDLGDRESRVRTAWTGFTSACSWVSIGSVTFTTGFADLLTESRLDEEWAKSLATAFATAGGGSMPNETLGQEWKKTHLEQDAARKISTEGCAQLSPSEWEKLSTNVTNSLTTAFAPLESVPLAREQHDLGAVAATLALGNGLKAFTGMGNAEMRTGNKHVDVNRYSLIAEMLKSKNPGNWTVAGKQTEFDALLKAGKNVGRANALTGFGFAAASQVLKDAQGDYTTAQRVGRAATRATIVGVSSWAGAGIGGALGGSLGAVFGPAGVVVGGALGAYIGGAIGGGIGDYLADKAVDFGGDAAQNLTDFTNDTVRNLNDAKLATYVRAGEAATNLGATVADKVKTVGKGVEALGDALSFWKAAA